MLLSACKKSQTDEERVRETMKEWAQAIKAQDIDAIAACYSENFTSMDGDGRDGVRQMWTEIKELGMLEKIEINLDSCGYSFAHPQLKSQNISQQIPIPAFPNYPA